MNMLKKIVVVAAALVQLPDHVVSMNFQQQQGRGAASSSSGRFSSSYSLAPGARVGTPRRGAPPRQPQPTRSNSASAIMQAPPAPASLERSYPLTHHEQLVYPHPQQHLVAKTRSTFPAAGGATGATTASPSPPCSPEVIEFVDSMTHGFLKSVPASTSLQRVIDVLNSMAADRGKEVAQFEYENDRVLAVPHPEIGRTLRTAGQLAELLRGDQIAIGRGAGRGRGHHPIQIQDQVGPHQPASATGEGETSAQPDAHDHGTGPAAGSSSRHFPLTSLGVTSGSPIRRAFKSMCVAVEVSFKRIEPVTVSFPAVLEINKNYETRNNAGEEGERAAPQEKLIKITVPIATRTSDLRDALERPHVLQHIVPGAQLSVRAAQGLLSAGAKRSIQKLSSRADGAVRFGMPAASGEELVLARLVYESPRGHEAVWDVEAYADGNTLFETHDVRGLATYLWKQVAAIDADVTIGEVRENIVAHLEKYSDQVARKAAGTGTQRLHFIGTPMNYAGKGGKAPRGYFPSYYGASAVVPDAAAALPEQFRFDRPAVGIGGAPSTTSAASTAFPFPAVQGTPSAPVAARCGTYFTSMATPPISPAGTAYTGISRVQSLFGSAGLEDAAQSHSSDSPSYAALSRTNDLVLPSPGRPDDVRIDIAALDEDEDEAGKNYAVGNADRFSIATPPAGTMMGCSGGPPEFRIATPVQASSDGSLESRYTLMSPETYEAYQHERAEMNLGRVVKYDTEIVSETGKPLVVPALFEVRRSGSRGSIVGTPASSSGPARTGRGIASLQRRDQDQGDQPRARRFDFNVQPRARTSSMDDEEAPLPGEEDERRASRNNAPAGRARDEIRIDEVMAEIDTGSASQQGTPGGHLGSPQPHEDHLHLRLPGVNRRRRPAPLLLSADGSPSPPQRSPPQGSADSSARSLAWI